MVDQMNHSEPPPITLRERAVGGTFTRSVPTGEVLTGALSKLNSVSLNKLLGELTEAINSCCQEEKLTWPSSAPANEGWYLDISNAFARVWTDVTNLRVEMNKRREEIIQSTIDQRVDTRTSNLVQTVWDPSFTEINAGIDKIMTMVSGFFGDPSGAGMTLAQIIAFVSDVRAEISNLHVTFNRYEESFADIHVEIRSLWAQINLILQNTSEDLRKIVAGHEERISTLEKEMQLLQQGKVLPREVILNILVDLLRRPAYISQIFTSIKININNTSKTVIEILELLARAEHVREVKLVPGDTDILGATYILTDGCAYDFRARLQNLEGDLFKYIFESDWNGLPAMFSITFRATTTKWTVCEKEVSFTAYEPVSSTNIEFALV